VGLDSVALGEVALDQCALRRLPQRVGAHGNHRRLDGLRAASECDELPAQSLQRVQHLLPQPVPLGDRPVVAPGGQQLECTDPGRQRGQVGRLRPAADQPGGPVAEHVRVDNI
jgi:hypothetical protein